jgi:hypothetical protein
MFKNNVKHIHMYTVLITLTLIVGISLTSSILAQMSSAASAMNKPTSRGILNVVVQPSPNPLIVSIPRGRDSPQRLYF